MTTARFADSYYIFNTLLVLAFVPLRLYFRIMTPDGSDHGTLHSLHELANWVRLPWLATANAPATQQQHQHHYIQQQQQQQQLGANAVCAATLQERQALTSFFGILAWQVRPRKGSQQAQAQVAPDR